MNAFGSGSESMIFLNVGGVRFTTSRSTLTWIGDSFFTSLLSGRIPVIKDEVGATFIDRDPVLFGTILSYLRSKHINISSKSDLRALKHEAQFYGLTPLIKRLTLCEELEGSPCGDVLFHGFLPTPPFPLTSAGAHQDPKNPAPSSGQPSSSSSASHHNQNASEPLSLPSRGANATSQPRLPTMDAKFQVPSHPPEWSQRPAASGACAGQGGAPRSSGPSTSGMGAASAGAISNCANAPSSSAGHSRTGSADFVSTGAGGSKPGIAGAHAGWTRPHGHAKRASNDLTRQIKADLSQLLKQHHQRTDHALDPSRVRVIRGHHNWVAVGYAYFVCCFRMKDSVGWQVAYCTPRMDGIVTHVALNAKFGSQSSDKMLAASLSNSQIHLWALPPDDAVTETKIGVFTLNVPVNTLFFIGNQLVALSKTGKVGIWHSMTQNWQCQDVVPISSYDTAGSFLLLGCTNGSINYIDMQKFPLRMKDNDLLVTELYRDPNADVITAISVYLTPKTNLCGNWIEIAYGTSAGAVRVIVQHPETVGHGPQLFQTFTVHQAPITHVGLTTTHLISVCSEYNHVRSWGVTRFRGMISTQPGSAPVASFKVLTLESNGIDSQLTSDAANVGPHGDQDGEQIFVQKIVPDTDHIFVRLASNGERVCVIRAVDGSSVSSFLVHECEGSNRMGSRPRRYLFTGHVNGSIQMWDLTTAMDQYNARKEKGEIMGSGPTPEELLELIDECEITCNSMATTPGCLSPSHSLTNLHQPSPSATNKM